MPQSKASCDTQDLKRLCMISGVGQQPQAACLVGACREAERAVKALQAMRVNGVRAAGVVEDSKAMEACRKSAEAASDRGKAQKYISKVMTAVAEHGNSADINISLNANKYLQE